MWPRSETDDNRPEQRLTPSNQFSFYYYSFVSICIHYFSREKKNVCPFCFRVSFSRVTHYWYEAADAPIFKKATHVHSITLFTIKYLHCPTIIVCIQRMITSKYWCELPFGRGRVINHRNPSHLHKTKRILSIAYTIRSVHNTHLMSSFLLAEVNWKAASPKRNALIHD